MASGVESGEDSGMKKFITKWIKLTGMVIIFIVSMGIVWTWDSKWVHAFLFACVYLMVEALLVAMGCGVVSGLRYLDGHGCHRTETAVTLALGLAVATGGIRSFMVLGVRKPSEPF
jgi:hypothetical protein